MSHEIESKLTELGLALPEAPAPAANYVPFVQTGNLVFVSGQISKDDTGLITGTLGEDADVSLGQKAAASCALALLAQLKAACNGDLMSLLRLKVFSKSNEPASSEFFQSANCAPRAP